MGFVYFLKDEGQISFPTPRSVRPVLFGSGASSGLCLASLDSGRGFVFSGAARIIMEDSGLETIKAVTGLAQAEAEALLARHGGDAAAAVDAFFNPRLEGGGSAAAEPADAIERLLNETRAQSEVERGSQFNGGGRMLAGRWTPASSSSSTSSSTSSSSTSVGAAPDREIHIAFCRRAILFFEAEPASRVRRRGVHTVGSMMGPYDKYPYLHWVGSMVEVHRVTDADKPAFKALVSDLASNHVPDVPFLRKRLAPGEPRPSISFILHDHRQHDAPAPLPNVYNSASFTGSGNSLGGNKKKRSQRAQSQIRNRRTDKEPKRRRNIFAVGVLAFSVLLPLICRLGFGVKANLFHAIAGGAIGAVFMRWFTSFDSPPVFTVDRNLKVTQLKFRVKEPPSTFTFDFNQDVHTLRTLHNVVSKHLRARARLEDAAQEPELDFELWTSFPRRILNSDDTTLAQANVLQESISVVML